MVASARELGERYDLGPTLATLEQVAPLVGLEGIDPVR
jgi:hypothetical protein